ncbi:MAG TPA: hydroxyphenylacetyl-CoA thioesterase PaaI [Alphaproteobacteria bacterium]|jgi:acyl-CoA thioesterase|nr:hydroxyphenylacetyl-CoA thioesterase PaaI [Alphaproteobacteria bacterium]
MNDTPIDAPQIAPAAEHLGISLELPATGRAITRMTVREDMLNQYRSLHGGYLFTLADTAFSYASDLAAPISVAMEASISFRKACEVGDQLTAVCEQRSLSRRTGVYDVTVSNQHGDVVALFRGTSYRAKVVDSPPETPQGDPS